jgi:hypothetical protein
MKLAGENCIMGSSMKPIKFTSVVTCHSSSLCKQCKGNVAAENLAPLLYILEFSISNIGPKSAEF